MDLTFSDSKIRLNTKINIDMRNKFLNNGRDHQLDNYVWEEEPKLYVLLFYVAGLVLLRSPRSGESYEFYCHQDWFWIYLLLSWWLWHVLCRCRVLFVSKVKAAQTVISRVYIKLSYMKKVAYHYTSNISCTFVGCKTVDHSDAVGVSLVGAAPTTSSFST